MHSLYKNIQNLDDIAVGKQKLGCAYSTYFAKNHLSQASQAQNFCQRFKTVKT